MKNNLRKNIETGVLFGLICAVMMSFSHFSAACEDVKSNVLRLHIIANSDSKEDQELKLKVRDAILSESGLMFDDCTNLSDAIEIANEDLNNINEIANRVIKSYGFSYTAESEVGDSYFETREYDDFTLPAGTYKSLIVRLGESKGHNWWCVIFPSVCLPAASNKELTVSTSSESADIVSNPSRYKMKFKAVEWYEDLKHKSNAG